MANEEDHYDSIDFVKLNDEEYTVFIDIKFSYTKKCTKCSGSFIAEKTSLLRIFNCETADEITKEDCSDLFLKIQEEAQENRSGLYCRECKEKFPNQELSGEVVEEPSIHKAIHSSR